jgi:hypothetical protein
VPGFLAGFATGVVTGSGTGKAITFPGSATSPSSPRLA